MLDGRANELRRQGRTIANWMAPLLTATTGQPITAAQLLGEEPTADSVEDRLREGERLRKKFERRLKRQKQVRRG